MVLAERFQMGVEFIDSVLVRLRSQLGDPFRKLEKSKCWKVAFDTAGILWAYPAPFNLFETLFGFSFP